MTETPLLPKISIARLHRDKIELYEQIHNGMSTALAEATRRAYRRIDIYRLDDLLVMITEEGSDHDAGRATDTPDGAEEARLWHEILLPCFAEFWRPADAIFLLADAGKSSR